MELAEPLKTLLVSYFHFLESFLFIVMYDFKIYQNGLIDYKRMKMMFHLFEH